MQILVTGAAGSGTSTLGESIASRWGAAFIEADSFFWLPTERPFTEKRTPEERGRLMVQALNAQNSCVIAGSVMDWGSQIENVFGLIIFLYVPTEVRLLRLKHREFQRFGRVNPVFLEWAAQYDAGSKDGRSLSRHNTWLANRQCQVIRLEGNCSVEDWLSEVERQAPRLSNFTSASERTE